MEAIRDAFRRSSGFITPPSIHPWDIRTAPSRSTLAASMECRRTNGLSPWNREAVPQYGQVTITSPGTRFRGPPHFGQVIDSTRSRIQEDCSWVVQLEPLSWV